MRQNTLFIKIFFTITLLLCSFFGFSNTKTIKVNVAEIKTTPSVLAIDVSNFSTTATAACINTASTVTIASTTLTSGTYTVTYNLSGAQTAVGQTASVDFSGGIGLFSTILLAPTGTTTITITKIDVTTVSSGNTAAILVSALPAQPSTISGSITVCPASSQAYSVTNVAGITYIWTFPSGWLQTAGGTTNSVTVKAGTTAGDITVTPTTTATGCAGLSRKVTTTLTASITSTTSGSRTGSGTVRLGATASGGTIAWYDALTGGTAVTMTAPNYTTPSIKQSTTYYVQTTSGGCTTPRVPVEAIINAPQINVLGGLPPDIYNPAPTIPYGDTTPIATDWTDFGSVTTRTYTIENKGNLPLNITSITSSNTTNFNITTNPGPLSIQPGTNATFTVTFTSADALSKSATITINNNDNDEGTYTFKIQAIKTTQEINVQGGTTLTNIASGNTASTTNGTDFAATKTQTYTIQNLGSAPLSITSISITTGGTYFSTPAVATTIASGDSYSFTVTFSPTNTILRSGVITIANNDSNEGTYLINIKGTAVAATIAFEGNAAAITSGATATTTNWTDFSTVATTRTFTIKNTGTLDLTISSFAKTGTNPTEFTTTATTPFTIPVGGSYSFTIQFTPGATGSRSAIFTFTNNSTNKPSFILNLKGTGVSPSMNVKGNNILIADGDSSPTTTDWTDFNNVVLGLFKTRTFQIENTGTMNLNLTGTPMVKISGSSDFTVSPLPISPVSGTSKIDLNIKFTPTTIGTQTALVTIANDDAGTNKNPYTFVIKAKGNQPYFNSDTDTNNDNVDVDDDNDGVLDATEELDCNNANGPKTNYKFLNETFGSGERTSINTTYDAISTYCYEDGSLTAIPATVDCPKLGYNGTGNDLDDGEYTVGSTAQIASWSNDFWYKGKDHTSPSDPQGRMAIFNASNDPQTFYTAVISGILPNVPVTYNFWAINLDRSDAPGISTRKRPKIRVEFRDLNDVVLTYPSGPLVGQNIIISTGAIAPTSVGNVAGDWKQFKADLTLNVNAFKVVFINDEVGGSGNDLAIDDIAITQTLCDTDSDGIPNVFDLDSDNDGIEDVVEAGLGNLSLGNGLIQTITDTNGDGIDDTAATKTRLDSDGDTVPNYIDLDSDNDSVFDVDEGPGNSSDPNFTNGDGDITGDGKGDGVEDETMRLKDVDGNGVTDTFGDGILPIYDKNPGVYGNLNHGTANANPATTYLKDTDGDGIPDYLDIMSNGTTFDITNNKLIYAPKILDSNNDGILDSTTDIDKDGIMDNFDTNTTSFGSPRDLGKSLFLDFDGRNDYAQDLTAVLNGQAKASIMAWIDLNSAFSGPGFIVGQDNFQLRVTNAKKLEVYCNTKTVTSATPLDTKRWYHVAAVYDGINVYLYLNGQNIGSIATTGSIVDTSKLTIGRSPSASTNFFKGKIDEVRVFNTGLTDNQVQRMVYQEIDPTSPKLKGTYITGKEIDQDLTTSTAALTFANMLRYYRMDTYKDDILDDLTTTTADVTGMKIYNTKNIYVQEAPMPFVTTTDNIDLATSITDTNKDILGTDVNNYNTIINVKHNVTTTVDRTDIGLIVDAGKSLTVNGDKALFNTWWLSLNGKIDLTGKSQLVQTANSDLDVTSAGYIERDQQGQSNKFNYNYWSSPVSPINTAANNTNYTVDGVMKDGFNATPRNINWISGYDGVPGDAGTAVSLAKYWLYKFESNTDAYANWVQFLETDALRVGQGYTLKGSGAASNFTFVGKPNNGTINSNTVSAEQFIISR